MRRRSLLQAVALAGFGRFAMAQSSAAAGGAAAGARGDQQRHYFFDAAGKDMPYRLYVPRSYEERVGAPLIVALHGYGGNQDYFFEAMKDLPALCEQYGVIFVAPMGFAIDGWYGAPLGIPGAAPRSGGGAAPTPGRTPEQETQYRALSEQDVLNVLDLVTREYKIDARRTYLMGHSMGGFGTWWLGQKYADRWAAIAPMSGVLPNVDYQCRSSKACPSWSRSAARKIRRGSTRAASRSRR